MKKIILCTALFAGFITAHSQGFYLKVNGGYNWPGLQNNAVTLAPRVDAAYSTSDGLVTMANIDDSAHSYKQVSHSYAAGANISLGVGYMITHWFGVELNANYLWGSSATSHVRSDMAAIGLPGQYIDANIKTFAKNGMTLTPMLVFVAAKKNWKVQPHAKLGLVLPFAGRVIHELDITSPISLPFDPFFVGNRNSVVMNTQSTVSIGFTGSIGVRYTPIPFLTVFADMNAQWLNIRAKKTTITKWEAHDDASGTTYDLVNGDPNDASSPHRSIYRTQFEYVNSLTSSSNNAQYNSNYDKDKPKQDARITAPASNVGIQIGIQFNLNKEAFTGLKKKKS